MPKQRVFVKALVGIAIAGAAGACSRGPERDLTAASPSEPVSSPANAPGSASPGSDAALSRPNQCGAERYRWLIGRNRSEIPVRPAGAAWRVSCTECALTEDYSPQRLNILFNQRTQKVEKVYCG